MNDENPGLAERNAEWKSWYANRSKPAPLHIEAPPIEPFVRRFKNADIFLREYEAISYTIDGVLPSSSIYGLTAKRGIGKTVLLTTTALAVSTGRSDLLGFDVEEGRVAFVALENPVDFRMKLGAACYALNIECDVLSDNLIIIDGYLKPEQILEQLRISTEEDGGFQLVVYDTFQAGFDGADFNNNAEVLAFTRKLRNFTTLPGGPSVLVAMHPTKSADETTLVPYGGGAIMNELDGNLSLWSENAQIKLGWNKVRGPEFEPRYFRIEMISTPDVVDSKGRQISLPVCRAVSAEAADEREKLEVDTNQALLRAMQSEPHGSLRDWAQVIGCSKSGVGRKLAAMGKTGLVEEILAGKWKLTAKGAKSF